MLVPIADDDVTTVVALLNTAYRGTGPNASWATESDFLAGDRTTVSLLEADRRASPHAHFLKWMDPRRGKIVGCVRLEPVIDGRWTLGSLATDPAQQGAGLGRALLAAAECWAKEREGRIVRMTVVNVKEALIDWYERRGYRPTGEIEPFPYDDDCFGIPLRPDLSFVVLEKALDDQGNSSRLSQDDRDPVVR